MNIKNLKRTENPNPPREGEQQFDSSDHLCEACGKWARLVHTTVEGIGHWVCPACYKDPMMRQQDLPY